MTMSLITITFPDGNSKEFEQNITAYEIAKSISSRLADDALAVSINGSIREIITPLTESASVKFLTFDDAEGKHVY